MKNSIIMTLLLAAILSACGGGPSHKYEGTPTTAPQVIKTDTTIDTHLESTPVIFNGQMLYISCDRDHSGVSVFDQNAVMIAHSAVDIWLCSAVVTPDGALHVFGARGNTIIDHQTKDLLSWSSNTVFTSDKTVYNTSVSADPTGYIMAYENCVGVCSFEFAHSLDIINWTKVGKEFDGIHFAACPAIRYVNGYYYALFTGSFNDDIYAVLIARSTDLITWQTSPQAVVSPLDGLDAEIGSKNASDLDFVEVAGIVLIEYQNFVQSGPLLENTGTRLAYFNGSEQGFLESFF